MEEKELIATTDRSIRDYLDNNKFLDSSNWSRIANTQLFRVDVISPETEFLLAYKSFPTARDQFLADDTWFTSLVTVQDVVGFSLPAERLDFASQTIFHDTRSAFVGSTRDQFRLRMIDNYNYFYRQSFQNRYGTVNENGVIHYNRTVTKFPGDYYFNLLVRQILKSSVDGLYRYGAKYFLKDCVTENINDIDYSVDKMSHLMTEITGKTKKIYTLQ